MERAVATYKAKGYSDEWQNAGIKESKEFAALTNILTIAWSFLWLFLENLLPIAVKIIAAFIFDVYRPCEK